MKEVMNKAHRFRLKITHLLFTGEYDFTQRIKATSSVPNNTKILCMNIEFYDKY